MNCRWIDAQSPRLLRTHLPDCEGVCDGCEPCPEGHCAACGREHVTVEGRGTDLTCAACIGAVRDDLALIGELSARMLDEATHRGINSEATVYAGPAANPEAWGYRRMSARAGRIPGDWLDDQGDEPHPTWVVGTWEMLVREHYNQVTDEPLTLASASRYLDEQLTHLAHDVDFAFDELARDLRKCRGKCEDVLQDGIREDRGAPCPMCGAKFLVKEFGDTEDEDRWTCRKCGEWWSEPDYRAKVAAVYTQFADRLTARQIADTYRVSERTIRHWGARGRVKKTGKDERGRTMYDVADVLALRDGE